MSVFESIKGLFKKEVDLVSPYERQNHIASEALARFKSFDVSGLLDGNKSAKSYFSSLLRVLDRHDVIDAQAVPDKGAGNCVAVPAPWGDHVVEAVNNFFDPEKWDQNKEYMEAVWDSDVPMQLKKLVFFEGEDADIGKEHYLSTLFLNNYAQVQHTEISTASADAAMDSALPFSASVAANDDARLQVQNIPHREEAALQLVVSNP